MYKRDRASCRLQATYFRWIDVPGIVKRVSACVLYYCCCIFFVTTLFVYVCSVLPGTAVVIFFNHAFCLFSLLIYSKGLGWFIINTSMYHFHTHLRVAWINGGAKAMHSHLCKNSQQQYVRGTDNTSSSSVCMFSRNFSPSTTNTSSARADSSILGRFVRTSFVVTKLLLRPVRHSSRRYRHIVMWYAEQHYGLEPDIFFQFPSSEEPRATDLQWLDGPFIPSVPSTRHTRDTRYQTRYCLLYRVMDGFRTDTAPNWKYRFRLSRDPKKIKAGYLQQYRALLYVITSYFS